MSLLAHQAETEYHVNPSGTADGDGSALRPWDLKTAFSATSVVKPGSVLWLHSGMYGDGGPTVFNSKFTGNTDAPIIVLQFPGDRATINGGIQAIGAFTVFWGFDITNTSIERTWLSLREAAMITMFVRRHRLESRRTGRCQSGATFESDRELLLPATH